MSAVGRQTKQVVYKVYSYFEDRKRDRSTEEYLNDINLAKTVSKVTGISKTTVHKIVKEGKLGKNLEGAAVFTGVKKKRCARRRLEIDSFIEGIIRRKVTAYYATKGIPSIKIINEELKLEGVANYSREYLRQTLKRIGFQFLRYKKKMPVERHDVMSQRWHYIANIKKYRKEGRSIIYLDEMYVNRSSTDKKSWQFNNECDAFRNNHKEPRLMVVVAGNRHGFVNNASLIYNTDARTGEFRGNINNKLFQKWVEIKLVPNIPRDSVVVMDNASYHRTLVDKKPNMMSLKSKMQEWLERQNVPYTSDMRKCDLMKIIRTQNGEKQYWIDEILKANGHTVLRLPPSHGDLNLIELVLKDFKAELNKTEAVSDMVKAQDLLESILFNYPKEKWSIHDDLIIKIENEYYKGDEAFDGEFDRLIKSLGDADSDGAGDDTDDESDQDSDEEEEYEVTMIWEDDSD